MLRPFFISALAATVGLCSFFAEAADDPLAAGRDAFRTAYPAAAIGATSVADSAALKAYPLYSYLQAARDEWALSQQPTQAKPELDARIAVELKPFADTPLERELRRVWLTSLAARRDWPRFLDEYRDFNDPVLRCTQLAGRAELGRSQGLAAEITQQWLTGANTPDACEPAFAWLRAQDGLPPSLIDQRARLALANGNSRLARKLAAILAPEVAAPLKQWATLIDDPQPEIEALIAAPPRPVEAAALLDGWQRLSRTDPETALTLYQPLLAARQLSAAEAAAPFARALALGLAWSRLPQAGEYFAKLTPQATDDLAREWQARAALWAGDWALAANTIAEFPPNLASQPRWQYWLARARERGGDHEAAQQLYAQLALGDGYHQALAAARLNAGYQPHPHPLQQNPGLQNQIAAHPAILRAHELWLCGMKPQAAAEWQYGFEALEPDARTQAAALALRWGWYDQGIAAASRQGIFDDYALLYPRPYDAPVHAAAALAKLPDDLVYAILRQESLYDSNAMSRAGALGLLQLLPETAQRTARRWQQNVPSRDALFDPATNLTIGAAELRDRLDQFGGELPVAIASYNAGPNAASRWLPAAAVDPDVWIENIPFNETRTYVQRVLWHRLVFRWRHTGEAQKFDDWLAPVTPLAVDPGSGP